MSSDPDQKGLTSYQSKEEEEKSLATLNSKLMPSDTFAETSIRVDSAIPENTPEIEDILKERSVQSSFSKNEENFPVMDTIGEEEMKEEKKDVVLNLPI